MISEYIDLITILYMYKNMSVGLGLHPGLNSSMCARVCVCERECYSDTGE